ncbi:uncharacterized protein LOC111700055 [Eurytemora carolleeae]|uniref:uncharacterized protein LOC111700055 n=1 Tax=Eurytemora carolleeae TaxID=1294199 RepID=UPI000C768F6E|nr:uncharacterized protein LOC111700055 [Eurytemora carolleeae]|eukprot:XP_023326641.1 uncharacterized protein LOC111700055 [Eurytemora affinis]
MMNFQRKSKRYKDYTGLSKFWIPYSDEENEGSFVNIYNSSNPLSLKWSSSPEWGQSDPEPNGLRRQNCVTAEYQTTIEEFAVFDRECNLEEYGTICQNEEFPTLILRGLCSNSGITTNFLPLFTKRSGLIFRKSMGPGPPTDIYYEMSTKEWVIRVLGKSTLARMKGEYDELPLGTNIWSIENDIEKCNNNNISLSLVSCMNTQFNCYSGQCISMELRCNGKSDCQDESDEQGCKTIIWGEGQYQKGIVPSPDDPSLRAKVLLSFAIERLYEIDDSGNNFKAKYEMSLEWLDPRKSHIK